MNVLIVVDMQEDFVRGALGTAEAQAIVPRVRDIISNFEGKIIYTRDSHEQDYLTTQEGQRLPVEHCVRGSRGWQILPEVYLEGAEIIDKPSFGSLDLASRLQELHREEPIEKITLIGLCTDICVISNAMIIKAALPEVPVSVISEGCAGVSPESHENALAAMRVCQIDVI